jgi:hypothetical protein
LRENRHIFPASEWEQLPPTALGLVEPGQGLRTLENAEEVGPLNFLSRFYFLVPHPVLEAASSYPQIFRNLNAKKLPR